MMLFARRLKDQLDEANNDLLAVGTALYAAPDETAVMAAQRIWRTHRELRDRIDRGDVYWEDEAVTEISSIWAEALPGGGGPEEVTRRVLEAIKNYAIVVHPEAGRKPWKPVMADGAQKYIDEDGETVALCVFGSGADVACQKYNDLLNHLHRVEKDRELHRRSIATVNANLQIANSDCKALRAELDEANARIQQLEKPGVDHILREVFASEDEPSIEQIMEEHGCSEEHASGIWEHAREHFRPQIVALEDRIQRGGVEFNVTEYALDKWMQEQLNWSTTPEKAVKLMNYLAKHATVVREEEPPATPTPALSDEELARKLRHLYWDGLDDWEGIADSCKDKWLSIVRRARELCGYHAPEAPVATPSNEKPEAFSPPSSSTDA